MITQQEWDKLENLLDQKLEEKLDQKLNERFDEFAQIMKRSFDEVYKRFDHIDILLDSHEHRITQNEVDIRLLKRAL
jgi:hypothetical protein